MIPTNESAVSGGIWTNESGALYLDLLTVLMPHGGAGVDPHSLVLL